MAADPVPFPLVELPYLSSYASLTNTSELLADLSHSIGVMGLTANAPFEYHYVGHGQVPLCSGQPWLLGGNGNYSLEYSCYPPADQDVTKLTERRVRSNQRIFGFLDMDLERIAKLAENWDGEGAINPSSETLESAKLLVDLGIQVAQASGDRRDIIATLQEAFLASTQIIDLPGIVSTGHRKNYRTTGLLTFDMPGIGISQSLNKENDIGETKPSLYPTVDGGVTLEWIYRGRELKCTAKGETIEVIRWQSTESYESDGLWDISVEQTREHFEWLMR